MKTTRIKADTSALTSRADFEALIDTTCKLQLDLEELVTTRDRELAAVRECHDDAIEDLRAKIKSNVIVAEKYAVTHRDSLFAKLKSAASSLAVYGFRTGNPTLVLLNRSWSWEKVLAALKAKRLRRFIVVKESPDKDGMKNQLSVKRLASVGTKIAQGETFYVEPKRDAPAEQRLTAEAA